MSGRRNRPKHPGKRTRFGTKQRRTSRPPRSKCGKVGYRDKQEALWWLEKLAAAKLRSGFTGPVENRVYECNVCRPLWHTTSAPQKTGDGTL